MEEHQQQRARFVSRSPGMGGAGASSSAGSAGNGGSGGGRSQWRGMDLHTSTPSSHRRAMYISPVPLQTNNTANHTGSSSSVNSTNSATSSSGDATRMRAEAAALSARNQVLHRRLSERKRFDSADYAMKMVRSAMQSDTKASVPSSSPSPPPAPASLSATASPPPTATSGNLAALQSPRLSPTHGRMVFAQALKDGRGRNTDYEMQDAPPPTDNQEMKSPSLRSGQAPTVAPARGYGGLQTAGSSGTTKSANAALSARNIMIQRKLQEKRHFDSADYQLARLGVSNDVAMEDVGEPALGPRVVPITRKPSPMILNADRTVASPVNSPSAARAAISRSNQMSPSARASSSATAFGGQSGAGKYGGLAGRSPSTNSQNDLRRNTLLRQQESFLAAQNPATSPVPLQQQQQHPSPATASSGNQKYGKLIAANILLRKNLKDRQRFDSADYEMEAAAKQADRAGGATAGRNDNNAPSKTPDGISRSTSNQDDEPSSPVMKPQAKHIKLSDATGLSAWAAHPKVAAAAQQAQQPVAARGGWSAHPAVEAARQTVPQGRGDGARLAARNVLLSRKLSVGKKHFDSGEYFAAKDKEARAASNRGQVQR